MLTYQLRASNLRYTGMMFGLEDPWIVVSIGVRTRLA